MRFDALPIWARSLTLFGSDNEGDGADTGATGAAGATVTDPPDDKPDADKPVNINPEDHAKAIRDRDSAQSELAALRQEKQEREEAEEAAKAATRSKEENLEKENNTLKEDNQKLTLVNTENLLELAILKNSKYQWENPGIVTKLIDRSEVKIDAKTGKVEGVEDALKALAKENPYLLKKTENGTESTDGAGTKIPGQPSGGTPSSSKDSSAKANKRKAMVDRFGPVLVP